MTMEERKEVVASLMRAENTSAEGLAELLELVLNNASPVDMLWIGSALGVLAHKHEEGRLAVSRIMGFAQRMEETRERDNAARETIH